MCLLVDGIGVRPLVQDAAMATWGSKSGLVAASWLVRDSQVSGPKTGSIGAWRPGFRRGAKHQPENPTLAHLAQ